MSAFGRHSADEISLVTALLTAIVENTYQSRTDADALLKALIDESSSQELALMALFEVAGGVLLTIGITHRVDIAAALRNLSMAAAIEASKPTDGD